MHLHWKYRELVKIITGGRSIEEVTARARTLEAESGGILVAVERVSKGFAIIVYRGKNYSRPACLRPRSLLSKREAMKRSLEAQRREVKFVFIPWFSFHPFVYVVRQSTKLFQIILPLIQDTVNSQLFCYQIF